MSQLVVGRKCLQIAFVVGKDANIPPSSLELLEGKELPGVSALSVSGVAPTVIRYAS